MFRLILIITFTLTSTLLHAEDNLCPFLTYGLLLEVGNDEPYPNYIKPYAEGDADTDPAIWNNLSEVAAGRPLTAHCFPNKYGKVEKKVLLENGIEKCTLIKKIFWCEKTYNR